MTGLKNRIDPNKFFPTAKMQEEYHKLHSSLSLRLFADANEVEARFRKLQRKIVVWNRLRWPIRILRTVLVGFVIVGRGATIVYGWSLAFVPLGVLPINIVTALVLQILFTFFRINFTEQEIERVREQTAERKKMHWLDLEGVKWELLVHGYAWIGAVYLAFMLFDALGAGK